MEDLELIELKNRVILGIIVALIVAVSVFFFFRNRFSDFRSDVLRSIRKDETFFIFFTDSNNCSNCLEVLDYLDKLGVKYYKYDVDVERDLDELSYSIRLNKDLIAPPGIMYIEEGKALGNIMDIDDMEVVESFIDRYSK